MTAACEPLPPSIADEMSQVVARAIRDRPGESPAQCEARTRQMVHSTMGMRPRDGLEFMLSTMLVGHFHLILHSMHEVFGGQTDTMGARTKSTIVALDRAMIGMIREFRAERRRPLSRPAENTQTDVAAEERPALEPAAFMAEMAPAPRAPSEEEKDEPGPRVTRRVVSKPTRAVAAGEGPDDIPSWADAGTIDDQLAAFEKVLGTAAECLEATHALDDTWTAGASAD
jgi:hypothetical protein